MNILWQDLRFGARMLVKNPGFTLIAVITLALGIGANTAIFSIINTVLLKPLPFASPERIVAIGTTDTKNRSEFGSLSYPNFSDYRTRSRAFERMAVYRDTGLTLTGAGAAVSLEGVMATADLFQILGAKPLYGRTFLPNEDKAGGGRVVALSHGAWRIRFNADPNVVGKVIAINGESYTVVGVMSPGFQFPIRAEPVEMWINYASHTEAQSGAPANQRSYFYLQAVGLLKPGSTAEQAEAELVAIAGELEKQYPNDNKGSSARVAPLLKNLTGDVSGALWVVFAAVCCVLLIACANVANLLLARSLNRRREIAVRAALGAGRFRLIRQLLTESVLLAALGAGAGIMLASFVADALIAITPADVPRIAEAAIDRRVLLFTLGATMLTGLVMGLIPAWQSSRLDLHATLKESGRNSTGARGVARGALVVAEVAIAVVLLVGAGLLIQSFARLLRVNPGFDPRQILTMRVGLSDASYPRGEQRAEFHDRLLAALESLPGVTAYSSAAPMPLSGSNYTISLDIEGRPKDFGNEFPYETRFFMIGPGYFHALGTAVEQGREFDARDNSKALPVVVINEAFAKKYFPNEDPLGKRIKLGISAGEKPIPMREIVGVVADTRSKNPSLAPEPEAYLHIPQVPAMGSFTLVLRAQRDPQSLTAAIREAVTKLDRNVPVSQVRTLDDYLSRTLDQPRFNSLLLGVFAGVALLLTSIGLYGVVAYAVSQRTQEIGIRLALGAQARDVLKLVLSQGLGLVLIGLALGGAGALALTRFMTSLLFGVSPTDPLTFAGIALLLTIVALLACWIPARRAMKVDPMVALRCE
ncbi:MAG TPA: ABC transporter permease [Blastocatellia bacterium]|jgi:putative ABC transport system permease protein|nr:ABC transporter permease [Blastocatellia bacterium]